VCVYVCVFVCVGGGGGDNLQSPEGLRKLTQYFPGKTISKSRDRLVGIATAMVQFPGGYRISSYSTASRPVLGHTQPPIE
jgi:hypothetical protein